MGLCSVAIYHNAECVKKFFFLCVLQMPRHCLGMSGVSFFVPLHRKQEDNATITQGMS